MDRYDIESMDPYDAVVAPFGLWVLHDDAKAALDASAKAERDRCMRVCRYYASLYDSRLEGKSALDALIVIEGGGDVIGKFGGVDVVATSRSFDA